MSHFSPLFQVSNHYFLKQRLQDKNLLNAAICTHTLSEEHSGGELSIFRKMALSQASL